MTVTRPMPPISLIEYADLLRVDAARMLSSAQRTEWGQFFTPPLAAQFMASMFSQGGECIYLLDAGAGTGALIAAFVSEACRWREQPKEITVTAYEIDPKLIIYLKDTLELCEVECARNGIKFRIHLIADDFIKSCSERFRAGLFENGDKEFTHAILNPPYRKIRSSSDTRRYLRAVGIETSNLYTAFLALTTRLLTSGGQLVAITPRSFCNGSYFRLFRKSFLEEMTFKRIHVFESRDITFVEDEVLQENIVFHAIKLSNSVNNKVIISSSKGPQDDLTFREVNSEQLVRCDDPDSFIHIVTDEKGSEVADRMNQFACSLADLGISVSTGRVVEFRSRNHLWYEQAEDTVPLIYPHHFSGEYICHPKPHLKKANWIMENAATEDVLVTAGIFVLVKRFSAKEESRRVVAALYDPALVPAAKVGFENHLNYFHERGKGLNRNLAQGLTAFLNSTLVDAYFRQFNGHTQVNATDLRSLKYPNRHELETLGARLGGLTLNQENLDQFILEQL